MLILDWIFFICINFVNYSAGFKQVNTILLNIWLFKYVTGAPFFLDTKSNAGILQPMGKT